MLGNILGALTDAASAEEALAAIGDPGVVERVRRGAAAEGVGVGTFVASTVRSSSHYGKLTGEPVVPSQVERSSRPAFQV